ncbi:MAG: PAS domain S-box protein [Deltaproteobacteria bacterium]|nr:PAS domain S-box protein [Deltaproteobacteria bacterium]MDQ3297191.1 PAS domain S-box protein [Myxococcota bacterium]
MPVDVRTEQPARLVDQAEDRFRLLVENVKDYAIIMLDTRGHIVSWNAGAERLKGYAAREIIGRHFSAFYTPEDTANGKPDRELQIASRTGRYEEEGWRVRKDGSRFWANVVNTALVDERGTLQGFGQVTRDFTERKQAEEELRLSEERFRLMVQSVKDYAIFFLDAEGRISSWNEGARRIKGYTPEEILGKHFRIFYPPDAVAARHPEHELEVASREGSFEEEGVRVRNDGTTFWANVVITAMRDAKGELLGFVKVTRDVTDRRRAEDVVRQAAVDLERRVDERTAQLADVNAQLAENNHELEAFSYSVSHDLRAPLRAIDGFSKRVMTSAVDKLDESERDQLQRVRAAAQRMSQLIDDLLNLSRLNRVRVAVKRVDVSALARGVVEELHRSTPDRVVDVQVAEAMQASADPRLLKIAFENLLGNAWKFTRTRSAPRIEVSCTERDGRTVFFVRDNGVGFDLKYAEKLFFPFQRLHSEREFEGTGIGLATVQRIIRRHGGAIWAESEPDRGATFYFSLESST